MIKRIFKILLNILMIIVVIIFTVLPAVYTNSIFGYLPILMLVISLLLSLICLFWIKKGIVIASSSSNREVLRGLDVPMNISVTNRTHLICPKAQAKIFIKNLFGDTDSEETITFTLASKNQASFNFDLDMNHIGIYEVGIHDMLIYDFFGIFKMKVPIEEVMEVSVMPRISDIDELEESSKAFVESSQETRMTVTNGMDYVGVREYELGDPMKQIHWKLSAHSLGYMTKLQESNRELEFSVILDFVSIEEKNQEILMNINDALIETSFSILDHLSKKYTSYSLIYYSKDKKTKKVSPKGRDNDREFIKDFVTIAAKSKVDYPDAYSLAQQEANQGQSSNIIICTSYVSDQLVDEMIQLNQQAKNVQLFYIIPIEYNHKKIRQLGQMLYPLDEAGISHFYITAGGEKI